MVHKKLLVSSLVVVILILTVALIIGKRKIGPAHIGSAVSDSVGQSNYGKAEKKRSDLPSCGDKMDFFTVSPIKSEDYGDLIPLGNLNPTGHVFPTDHIYLFSKNTPGSNGETSEAFAKPLYSPGDMWITEISTSEDLVAKKTDYAIVYQPCAEFEGKFGHVGRLSAKLKAEVEKITGNKCDEYTTGGSQYRACWYGQLKIFVKAGEELGTVFNGRSAALDIWAMDFRSEKLKFANPDRWREESFYNVCPAHYFAANIKKEMLGRFSGYDRNEKRTIEPVCGTVDVDRKGTAQGHWFSRDHTQYSLEDKNMALTNDNKNPLQQAFSMGNSGESKGYKSGVNYFMPEKSGTVNRDFAEVKPDGSVYCYETTSSPNIKTHGIGEKSVLYLSMPNDKTIRVERANNFVCDQGPWIMTNYVEFVR